MGKEDVLGEEEEEEEDWTEVGGRNCTLHSQLSFYSIYIHETYYAKGRAYNMFFPSPIKFHASW